MIVRQYSHINIMRSFSSLNISTLKKKSLVFVVVNISYLNKHNLLIDKECYNCTQIWNCKNSDPTRTRNIMTSAVEGTDMIKFSAN